MRPKIDKDAMKPLKVKEGDTIEFDVPFDGEPMPEVTWTRDDTPLTNNDRTNIVNTDDEKTVHKNTKFNMKNAVRGDSGKFKLTVKNKSGEDSCEVEVVVLCKYQNLHCGIYIQQQKYSVMQYNNNFYNHVPVSLYRHLF